MSFNQSSNRRQAEYVLLLKKQNISVGNDSRIAYKISLLTDGQIYLKS